MFQRSFFIFLSLLGMLAAFGQKDTTKPVRVAIVGLVHAHVHGILAREKKGDIEIVGIAEPNRELSERYSKEHGFSMNIVYSTMQEMIDEVKPEAVFAFNSIFDHLAVVEYCAPRGIHVMVEKPLAANMEHANKMLTLARRFRIQLMTNYETTWYGSNEKAWQLINDQKTIGDIRKIVFHTGHQGPVEIGCNKEFLDWLTDPQLNGGGALTDFGCYGADIATWLMKGETPVTVTAVTQQMKPELYPRVEDEATIILTYRKAQVIIQASWNWPYSRKDMEVYGTSGAVFCMDNTGMLTREGNQKDFKSLNADKLPAGRDDPFAYFAGVIRGQIPVARFDLSAPATNEIVCRILEAAKESARAGKEIKWAEFFPNKLISNR